MKSYLFDTSVIIAASFSNHPHYERAYHWIEKAQNKKIQAFVSSHCLAELYSNLMWWTYPRKIIEML